MKRLFTTRTVHEWIFGYEFWSMFVPAHLNWIIEPLTTAQLNLRYSAKLIKSLFKYPGFFPNFDPKGKTSTGTGFNTKFYQGLTI